MSAPKRKKLKGQLKRLANAQSGNSRWKPTKRQIRLAKQAKVRISGFFWNENRWHYK